MSRVPRPEPEPSSTPEPGTTDPEDPIPQTHDGASTSSQPTDEELLVGAGKGDGDIEVLVQRTRPKYPAFIGTGVVLGLLIALVLTLGSPANPEYSPNSVLSYLSLVFGLLGGALGGVVALTLDRLSDRRPAKRR